MPLDVAPGLTVAAVARRLGVAPSTLRTWERRYGVGPSGHIAGARRRYTLADLARLEHMRRLTLDGVSPADAARMALGVPADAGAVAPPRPSGWPPGPLALVGEESRGGYSGRVVSVPEGNARARGLARAALALDPAAIRPVVDQAVGDLGVIGAWESMLAPVLRAIGDRWAATGDGVEVEHLLAECLTGALRRVAERVVETRMRPILLACPDSEAHGLPLWALAAGLAERGVATRVLGAAVPVDALVAAVRRTGPAVLFLYSQQAVTASRAAFDALPVTRPPTAVLAGGAGWDPALLPRRVTYAHDLGQAVHLVQVACGVG